MDWIAVDTGASRDLRVHAFAEEIRVPKLTALGHLVCVWSALAEQSDERGNLAAISDALLEEWAMWRGRKLRFAKAFRAAFQQEDGTLRGWEKRNGAFIRKARIEAERKREFRAASGGQSTDADADSPRTRTRTGAGTVPDLTKPLNYKGELQKKKPSRSARKTPRDTAGGHDTWMTPFAEVWAAAEFTAGTFPFGKAAKPLRTLLDLGHAPEYVARCLGAYLSRKGVPFPARMDDDDSWRPATFKPDFVAFAQQVKQFDGKATFAGNA